MKRQARKTLRLPLAQRALKALKAAVEKAAAEHAKAGVPMSVWRNGRVVRLSPKRLRATAASNRR
jgi:hypothetical protein